ncbi:hypothetical protein [Microvirga mediterraneensis]|uniref:Uncharacterized protein n=1 Tax=Microvirga mediterraneensis TaxID=2754695 RepID=A0A838BRF2_9HYPH|nr:hypothetical protein [Microvirga mediterraneensis]MBA1157961.1 hypothetical protein [Microvirga mediterraneensis]
MTPNQVELVAQAFYASEHSDDWDDAPEVVQEEFRDLARVAISLLHQQTSRLPPSLTVAKEAGDGRRIEISGRC